VSSQRIVSTPFNTSTDRNVMSAKLPIGVGTMYSLDIHLKFSQK